MALFVWFMFLTRYCLRSLPDTFIRAPSLAFVLNMKKKTSMHRFLFVSVSFQFIYFLFFVYYLFEKETKNLKKNLPKKKISVLQLLAARKTILTWVSLLEFMFLSCSRTRFRVNPHYIVAWMSRYSLLETVAKPEV